MATSSGARHARMGHGKLDGMQQASTFALISLFATPAVWVCLRIRSHSTPSRRNIIHQYRGEQAKWAVGMSVILLEPPRHACHVAAHPSMHIRPFLTYVQAHCPFLGDAMSAHAHSPNNVVISILGKARLGSSGSPLRVALLGPGVWRKCSKEANVRWAASSWRAANAKPK
jgi:hypothetical protein